MRHHVLIRSAYGPEWTAEANARRLRISRAVTIASLAAQTCRDFGLVVLVNRRDPLRREREAAFREARVPVRFIRWNTEGLSMGHAPWSVVSDATPADLVAATAYRADWAKALEPRDELILQTRLDDDDALAPDAISRVQVASRAEPGQRIAWILPMGIRIWDGRETLVRHETNAMQTLQTPPGDRLTVYDYGHRQVAQVAPVRLLDDRPGWLWVRHQDTISGFRDAETPISPETRRLFPIEWAALA